MESSLTPTAYLVQIQKKKYTYLLFPIFLVLVSFIGNFYQDHWFLKILSLIGFGLYLFISFLFRIKRIYQPVATEKNSIVSPIYGSITTLSDQEIIIQKRWFDPIEIRYPSNLEKTELHFDKSITSFHHQPSQIGQLYGIVLGKVSCKIQIPSNMTILVHNHDSVQAGISLLAEKKTDEQENSLSHP